MRLSPRPSLVMGLSCAAAVAIVVACATTARAPAPSVSSAPPPAAPARGGDESYEVTDGQRIVRVWLPAGHAVMRGAVVYVNMASGDTRVAPAKWQALGRLYGFGYLGTKGFGNDAAGKDGQAVLAALDRIAARSGRPELRNLPFICAGFSNGGNFAFNFNAWRPDRVIAFNADKGTLTTANHVPDAALRTPGIIVSGEKDSERRRTNLRNGFLENRPRGALWAFLEQEATGHDTNGTHHVFLTFYAHAIERRYPKGASPLRGPVALAPVNEAEGWLADNESWKSGETRIAPFAAYTGDRAVASWLLDADVAALYRSLATYGALDAISNPQGLSAPAGQGIELKLDPARLPEGWTGVELFDAAQKIAALGPGTLTHTLTLGAGLHGVHGVVTSPAGKRYVKPLTFAFYGAEVAAPIAPDAGVPLVSLQAPGAPDAGP